MPTCWPAAALLPLLLLLLGSQLFFAEFAHSKSRKTRNRVAAKQLGIALNDRERRGCELVGALTGAVSCETFLSEYWEKKPLLSEATGADAALKFSTKSARRMLRMWSMKVNAEHGQVIFIRPNSFTHDSRWPEGSAVTPEIMADAVAAGNTVVVHNMEIYWKPIGIFCEALAKFTNLYAQANMYYSPAGQSTSVSPHQDAQSVFIVQLEGSKQWTLYEPRQPLGLKPQLRGKAGDIVRREEMGAQLLQVTLRPGDVLWIPRATFHTTSTDKAEGPSLHITIGVETDSDGHTWGDWLADAIHTMGKQSPMMDGDSDELRQAIPLQFFRRESTARDTISSKPAKQMIVQKLKHMLAKLTADVDDHAEYWMEHLSTSLDKRKNHLAAKEQQLLKFRKHFESLVKGK